MIYFRILNVSHLDDARHEEPFLLDKKGKTRVPLARKFFVYTESS